MGTSLCKCVKFGVYVLYTGHGYKMSPQGQGPDKTYPVKTCFFRRQASQDMPNSKLSAAEKEVPPLWIRSTPCMDTTRSTPSIDIILPSTNLLFNMTCVCVRNK